MIKKHWIKLDNAAKIFPAAAKGSNSQVFRLSCELTIPVDPAILQQALNETVSTFPLYQYVMRRGLFWYYLESTELMPVVEQEHKPPCSPLYSKTKKNLLYEVSYFKNRVNLEVFHVLSDGIGATRFLTALITKYLARVQGIDEPALPYHASYTQMNNDSFSEYYNDKERAKAARRRNSCKLKGVKYPENRLKLITGIMPVDELHSKARKYNTTITVFLCACLMNAISANVSLRAKRKPVVLAVPVNLRSVFPSLSARNFFGVVNVEYDYSTGSGELEDVIQKVGQGLKEGLTPQRLAADLNRFSAMEHNIFARVVPLALKNIIMRGAYMLSRRKVTAGLSNIGAIAVPSELEHIRSFDVFAATNPLQACVCSFKNRLSVSFTSHFISADIQQQFFRTLTEMGIAVELAVNRVDSE